jgi:hypothetical protein
MNALLEVKSGRHKMLLNPSAVVWAAPKTGENHVCVATMSAANEDGSAFLVFDCSYEKFKRGWLNALNYDLVFGDVEIPGASGTKEVVAV